MSTYFLGYNFLAVEYFFRQNPFWNYYLIFVSLSLFLLSILLFGNEVLEIKKVSLVWGRLYYVFIGSSVLLSVLSLVIDVDGANLFSAVLGGAISIYLLISGIISWKKGLRIARYLVLAYISITCQTRMTGNQVEVTIADTGIGIPKELIDSIFEQFSQVHSAKKDSSRGTGLGLAICKQIIEWHSGKIWAESSPGEGSAFKFNLPLTE